MSYAQIANGTIVQILTNLEGHVHQSLKSQFTQVDDTVAVGMVLTDGTWAYPEPTVPVEQTAEPVRVISKLDFLRRIGTEARVTIREMAKTNANAEDWILMLDLVDTVDLDHSDIDAGLTYFVAEGVLTEAQKADILA
jgi:hypothetical protein